MHQPSELLAFQYFIKHETVPEAFHDGELTFPTAIEFHLL